MGTRKAMGIDSGMRAANKRKNKRLRTQLGVDGNVMRQKATPCRVGEQEYLRNAHASIQAAQQVINRLATLKEITDRKNRK